MKKIKEIKILLCPEYTDFIGSPFINTSRIPPLGVAQLTAYLRGKGFSVDQDDLNIKVYHDNYYNRNRINLSIITNQERVISYIKGGNDPFLERLAHNILKKTKFRGIDIICLSASYHDNPSTFFVSLILARYLKRKYQVPIIVGGPIIALGHNLIYKLFELGCRQGIVDFLVKGPGEKTIYKLIESLNKKKDISSIKGLVYLRKNKLIDNGFGEFIFQNPDFDGLPLKLYMWEFPGFSSKFFNIKNKKILILPFLFIQGCPNHCIFCVNSASKNIWVLPPKEAVRRLGELSEKYNTKYFFFLSSTINLSKDYINELCDEIINNKLDILWSDCARFNDIDKNTLMKMRQAGCIRLIYGLETASSRMLNYIKKGIRIRKASDVLKLTSEAGIWTGLEIIAGLPQEKEEDISATLDFLQKNKKYIDNVYVAPFHLVEGSLLKSNPLKYGIRNIKEIDRFARPSEITYNKVSQIYSYDEVYGLKWDEKKEQISHSFKKIYCSQMNKITPSMYDLLPFLFFTYEKFKNKQIIKEKYNLFCRHLRILNSKCDSIFNILQKRFYKFAYMKK